ncbi:hypothetical protein D0N36_01980 [Hymenobacter lapidiphilus]|uniref:hypothetical protein n=1 Tax=Hymenobacter sp. CCM 8763 TaxID=2303334 RepID=UPI000E346906|nr:hypothetical protein [Hymenobacter sp. CCM 8763]RFP66878.1 hypothetical protein D0N36_01980 [Hymenobacter sp. CCM 8763]
MYSRPVRTVASLGSTLLLALLAAPQAQAQRKPRPVAPARPSISNDQPSYSKEFTYGVNFNTRGGLLGGVAVRSTRLLNQDWARFWSLELVEVKHPKEEKATISSRTAGITGTIVPGKSNYFFVARPSIGLQRVLFRKAPDAGVQVNGLLGGGPSIGLLMPYYINYNYQDPNGGPLDVRAEQYDPAKHTGPGGSILDRAPLFAGVGETKPLVGAHIRGALSFEFGRYRDAVTGVEVGVLAEAYAKTPVIIRNQLTEDSAINDRFLPSVYLTVYIGSRH